MMPHDDAPPAPGRPASDELARLAYRATEPYVRTRLASLALRVEAMERELEQLRRDAARGRELEQLVSTGEVLSRGELEMVRGVLLAVRRQSGDPSVEPSHENLHEEGAELMKLRSLPTLDHGIGLARAARSLRWSWWR